MDGLIIKNFCEKETRFLSNFYPYISRADKSHLKIVVKYMGLEFDNVESAYHAAKCKKSADRIQFQSMTPYQAKEYAENEEFEMRDDWAIVKEEIMYDLVWQKFHSCQELKEMLLATKDAILEEGNTWGDVYWGICDGIGENRLGKILMQIRNVIKSSK